MATRSSAKGARTPRYRELAEKLIQDIRTGRLSVGDRMPGELELQEIHGVSRHTIREALRVLNELGLIERRPGVGTVIVSQASEPSFVQLVKEPEELMRYPDRSRLKVDSVTEVKVSRAMAKTLQVKSGSQWSKISAVRSLQDSGIPICYVDIYVIPEYAAIADQIGRGNQPVYELISRQFDEKIARVEVDISADLLEPDAAELLGVEAGSPSLRLIRRYVGEGGRVFEISVSEHPAEHFNYSLEFRRGWHSRGNWVWG